MIKHNNFNNDFFISKDLTPTPPTPTTIGLSSTIPVTTTLPSSEPTKPATSSVCTDIMQGRPVNTVVGTQTTCPRQRTTAEQPTLPPLRFTLQAQALVGLMVNEMTLMYPIMRLDLRT